MIEYLEKWMYINWIENPVMVEVGQKIIENPFLKPIVFTQKWGILHFFAKLVNEEISLEEFFYVWDSTGTSNSMVEYMYSSNIDALVYIKTKLELDKSYGKNNIFILDKSLKTWKTGDLDIYFI